MSVLLLVSVWDGSLRIIDEKDIIFLPVYFCWIFFVRSFSDVVFVLD